MIEGLIASPTTIPVASEHGGFPIVALSGGVLELHALYLPGHTKETADALAEALDTLAWDLITTGVDDDNRMSRPPLSFGFKLEGSTWYLTKSAWLSSPARRRRHNVGS